MIEKEAKIFGAKPPSSTSIMSAIPYDIRRGEYVAYLNAKAKERPTDLLTAGGAGALLGAITGAASVMGSRIKPLVGLLIGALGGGLFGLLVRALDKGEIETAKRILKRGNIDPSLADFIYRTQRAKDALNEYKKGQQHKQTQSRLSRIERKLEKKASLCQQISGTLNESDFARFNDTFAETDVRRMIEKNAMVMECLEGLTEEPIVSTEKLASSAISSFTAGVDVVQVRPVDYGYVIKVSAAPKGVAPKEVKVNAQQAQQALPPEMLQAADQQGAATVTNVPAAPDPLSEKVEPATGFGLYKVTKFDGNTLVGYVIPQLFDPVSGQMSSMSLFTNGSEHSLSPQPIMGSLVGVNTNLPIPESPHVRGLGIFAKTTDKAVFATVPYNIVTKVAVEGNAYFAAQDMMGNDVRIIPSEGIATPVATSPQEIVIPIDFRFLPLENPVQLASAQEAMKVAQANAYDTMAEIRAWDTGCTLGGPVFEKVGSGQHTLADGVFNLAMAGVPQNVATGLLSKAASTGEVVRIFGLNPLSSRAEYIKEAQMDALIEVGSQEIPKRVNLLKEISAITFSKEASALVDIAAVDAVLSLNFLNPENIETFVENLPQLEDASTKLASLVLASQLGLQSIPKTAAVRAMTALEDVITGLKSLKRYSI